MRLFVCSLLCVVCCGFAVCLLFVWCLCLGYVLFALLCVVYSSVFARCVFVLGLSFASCWFVVCLLFVCCVPVVRRSLFAVRC